MEDGLQVWNLKFASLYSRAGVSITGARELTKYGLDTVGVQEIRWDRGGTEPAGN
jgi:hypothetical protein